MFGWFKRRKERRQQASRVVSTPPTVRFSSPSRQHEEPDVVNSVIVPAMVINSMNSHNNVGYDQSVDKPTETPTTQPSYDSTPSTQPSSYSDYSPSYSSHSSYSSSSYSDSSSSYSSSDSGSSSSCDSGGGCGGGCD